MLRRAQTIFSFVALIAIFGFYGWQEKLISQKAPPHNREEPGKTPNQNSNTGYIVAHSVAEKQNTERKQEYYWYSVFAEHPAEWLIAVFNGLLVYVTYRLVTTTGDLRRATDKLWEMSDVVAMLEKWETK